MNYDDNLGPYNLTITSDQLSGALTYKVLLLFPLTTSTTYSFDSPSQQYRRTIVIYGFYAMDITEAITIKIFGVVNPNRSDVTDYISETFGIGLLDSKLTTQLHGYSLIEAAYTIANISPSLAPGGVNFASIACTTTYSRTSSNYTFVIEPLQDVLSTTYGGQLYFDFP